MRPSRVLLLTIAALVAVAPALASDHDNTIRFGVQYVSPTGDYGETIDPIALTLEAVDALGPWFSYERRITPRFGVESALSLHTHDVDAGITELSTGDTATVKFGEVDVMPLVVGGNFHFPAASGADLYVGPQIGYVFYGDLDVELGSEKLAMKNAFAWGAILGFDVPLGERGWGFHARLQLLKFAAEVDEPGTSIELDIDPLILGVAAIRRF